MADLLFANNAVSTVQSSIGVGSTQLTLATGKGALFPSPGLNQFFKLTLEDLRENPIKREIVNVTQRVGDVLTIVRAQEGTAAQAFSSGFVASLRMTAETMATLSNAVNDFLDLFLGVFATPPTTDNNGNPLQLGAVYFNSTTLKFYQWDGTAWRGMLQLTQGVTNRLFYDAAGGQTLFGDLPDLLGNTLTLTPGGTEPVEVWKNGLKLRLDDGSGTMGQYTVDYANNRIVLLTGAALNDEIELAQLVEAMIIGVVDVRTMRDINLDPGTGTPGYINGARATFKIRDAGNNPVTPDSAFALQIYLDGVPQQPGVNFTVLTDEVTFDENLPAGTLFWGTYFDSMVA